MLIIIILIILVFLVAIKFGSEEKAFYMGADWFAGLKSGKKTVDVKPGDYEKHSVLVGQNVFFKHKTERIEVKVLKVVHHTSWDPILKDPALLAKIAPHLKSGAEFVEAMANYFDPANGYNLIYFEKIGDKKDEKKGKGKSKK